MERHEKKQVVEELKAELSKSSVAVLCDFKGMNVAQVNTLRAEFFKQQVGYRVVKNTLARLAMEGTPMLKALDDHLVGPTAIAYSVEDPAAPSRVLTKLLKDIPTLSVKAGYLDGRALSAKEVEALASMPGKNELRAMFLGLLAAPATQFVRTLVAGQAEFVRLLAARQKQQEEAPAPAAA